MATTLGNLVDRTIARLEQFSTNRPNVCTFNGWEETAGSITGVQLEDVRETRLQDAHLELESGEVIYILDHDQSSTSTSVPAWFRGQLGTPQEDTVATGTRVVINPNWTRYGVAQAVRDGIAACYPRLFSVKEYEFTPTPIESNYELPADVDQVIKVTREYVGPTGYRAPLQYWTFDAKNTDGKKYLRVIPMHASSGETVRVTYRAEPVLPDPSDFTATWSSIGLPDSAEDLPVLYAFYTLLPSADAAKLRSHSIPQSDHNRYVQAGSTNAMSRRSEELFLSRLQTESQKLHAKYPPQPHKTLSG